jgi:two-component system LytT family response regulator
LDIRSFCNTFFTMADLRALVVDDEPLARERLRNFLTSEPGVSVIGECQNGEDAVVAVRRDSPNLLFLDVQMPGLNGFEVLQRLNGSAPTAVIFTTAHDQYAVKAFEIHAVDYLLKPFDRERLRVALERARTRAAAPRSDDLQTKLAAMLEDMKAGAKQPERIPVKSNGKVTFVRIPDIDWIGSADNYVELHVGAHSHLIRETMNSVATRLPPEQFVRISRTSIVNLSRVKELQPLFHGEYTVTLTSGTRLTLSRSYRDQLPRLGVH